MLAGLLVALVLVSPQIGGSGKDGPLLVTNTLTLDTSKNGGVFEFTSIRIASGATLRLSGSNPATLLCQGDVDVAGSLLADGEDRFWFENRGSLGGPGGGDGGDGGMSWPWYGADGKGTGGGQGGRKYLLQPPPWQGGGSGSHATRGAGSSAGSAGSGPTYGSVYPFDQSGGSGGGGGGHDGLTGYGGAGGGGSIAILADGAITVTGTISANGGSTSWTINSSVYRTHGGPGSGGSILLRSLRAVQVSSTATITATGGWLKLVLTPWEKLGGDGFIRIDAYAATPDVLGTVDPTPLVLRLPDLHELTPPKLGATWVLSSAAPPGDVQSFYLALVPTLYPVPPFGTLELDISKGLLFLGRVAVPTSGIDPLAVLSIPVPPDPRLAGVRVWVQALNHVHAVTGRPYLSNVLATMIR